MALDWERNLIPDAYDFTTNSSGTDIKFKWIL